MYSEPYFIAHGPRWKLSRCYPGYYKLAVNAGTKRYPRWEKVAAARKLADLMAKVERRRPDLVPFIGAKLAVAMAKPVVQEIMASAQFPTKDWIEQHADFPLSDGVKA